MRLALPLILLMLVIQAAIGAEIPAKQNILVLVSYHRGMPWADAMTNGIEKAFAESGHPYQLLFEYMDTKRHPPQKIFPSLAEFYARKYAGIPIAVIISCDDSALDFLVKYHARLFPDAPVIFCGVNFYNPTKLDKLRNITGLIEYLEIRKTLQTALQLHPQARKLYIINDNSPTGLANLALLNEILPDFREKIAIEILDKLSMEELLQKVKAIPKNDLILLLTFNYDRLGNNITYEDSLRRLRAVASAPIYGLWSFYLGLGIVGGCITDGEIQGLSAARLALKVLSGVPASTIPVTTQTATPRVFDQRELDRFGISSDQLPSDSTIINTVPSFYKDHRDIILIGGAVMLLEGLLIVILIVNIISRHRLEWKLRDSRQQLHTILLSIGDAVIAVDAENRIMTMNRIAEKLTGWSVAEANGHALTEVTKLVSEENRGLIDFPVSIVIAEKKTIILREDTVMISKDNSEYHVVVSGSPIVGADNHVAGVVIIFRDITNQFALEKQFRQSQKMDALGRLAGGIAHDFGNVLQVIMGYAEVLDKRLPDETAKGFCREIIAAGNSGKTLVEQLLAFTSADLPEKRTLIDINVLLHNIRAILSRLLGDNIRIVLNPSEHPLKTVVNASLIEQAIINLCLNARDAMPDGGLVTISAYLFFCNDQASQKYLDSNEGPYVCCEVADNGTGIPHEIQPRIFEPFFTTRQDEKRAGLGLTSAYSIIRKHNGFINVYSEPGKGTVMRLYLPVAGEDEEELYHQCVTDKEFLAAKNNETLLIVEDDNKVRKLGRHILESAQYQVLEAADGLEAIALFREHAEQVNLVLLDIVLPGKSGLDVAQVINSINPAVPILFCSGYTEELLDHPEVTRNLITKPYQRNELLNRIKEELLKAEAAKKNRGTRRAPASP